MISTKVTQERDPALERLEFEYSLTRSVCGRLVFVAVGHSTEDDDIVELLPCNR